MVRLLAALRPTSAVSTLKLQIVRRVERSETRLFGLDNGLHVGFRKLYPTYNLNVDTALVTVKFDVFSYQM